MAQDVICVMQTLRAAARQVSRRYEQALRPIGLTASQFTLLQTLTAAPGLGPSALGEALGLEPTTVTRLLATLERQGFVQRKSKGADARRTPAYVTAAGEEAYARALPIWQETQIQTLAHVSRQDWATVRQFLHHLSR